MSQQINLYQPMFRAQRKVFSALTIAQIGAVFIVGLLLIYGYGRWQVARLETQVAALEARRATAMEQLQTLSAQARPPSRSQLVDEQLRAAQSEADTKQRMLRALQNNRFGNTAGFSAHYAGLARQRVAGLWLTRVEIRDDGIAFDGATEAAELLPRYLTRLGREQAFAGTDFARLRMDRGGDGDPVTFTVSTSAAEGMQ